MDETLEILATAQRWLEAGEAFVLATVVRVQGSTPRNAGARMLWRPGMGDPAGAPESDPSALVGTVGGGQFERLVIDDARRFFNTRTGGIERYVLGAEADQCCGGVMEVFFEYHGPRARVVVFGAGHVSQALADLLTPSPLRVVIVDDRPDWNSPERFPRSERVLSWDDGVAQCRRHPAETLAVVMTCSHDTDFQLLRRLLREPQTETPAFVGLIGSRSKKACLFGRLIASGLDERSVAAIRCPVGVGDTGKEPRLVAISIAAQLLIEGRRLGQPEKAKPAAAPTSGSAS